MPDSEKKFTAYTYQYKCDGWFMKSVPWTGTRSFIHEDELDPHSQTSPKKQAEEDALKYTKSSKCSVDLLQSFHMTVKMGEPYKALINNFSVQ